jgi:hypothetical protein
MTFWEGVGAAGVALVAYRIGCLIFEHLFEWDPH